MIYQGLTSMFDCCGGRMTLPFLVIGLVVFAIISGKKKVETAKRIKIIGMVVGLWVFCLSNFLTIQGPSFNPSEFGSEYIRSFAPSSGWLFMGITDEVDSILKGVRYALVFLSVFGCSIAALSLQKDKARKFTDNKIFIIMLISMVGFTLLAKVPVALRLSIGFFNYISYLISAFAVLLAIIIHKSMTNQRGYHRLSGTIMN